MPRHRESTESPNGSAEEAPAVEPQDDAPADDRSPDFLVSTTTVGLICVGAALFEAALIPGMIIGVAAMLAPKALPKLSESIEPAFREVVRGAYKVGQKARYVVAEAEEEIRDVIAEENAGTKQSTPDS